MTLQLLHTAWAPHMRLFLGDKGSVPTSADLTLHEGFKVIVLHNALDGRSNGVPRRLYICH